MNIDDLRLEPLVIDNIVPVDVQNVIDTMYKRLDWRYRQSTISNKGNLITDQIYDIGQFSANIYSNDSTDQSKLKILRPLLDIIENYTGKISVERAKFNFTWHSPNVNLRTQSKHVDSHDDKSNVVTILYYVNNSDGDTKIWYEDKIISISPKKGRLLIFPANFTHAGTNPSFNQSRIVLNIVAKINEV